MKLLLSCLLFCFSLFYSASSAAYNEAMCILIKQEMQQYNNNKASRLYRNAARDFEKNCRKPSPVRTQTKVVTKEKPIINETPTKQAKPLAIETHAAAEHSTPSLDPIKNSRSKNDNALEKPQSDTVLSSDTPSIHNQNTAAQQVKPIQNNTKQAIDTQKTDVQKTIVAPTQTPAPISVNTAEKTQAFALSAPKSSVRSLVLPSIVLLLVVLITLVVLLRLRHVKNNKQPSQTAFSTLNTVTETSTIQPSIATNNIKQNTTSAGKSEPTATDQTVTVKAKPELNTAEFEAAAKATLARIKNAADFAEPQVREFDPQAKQTKKQRKPINQPTEQAMSSKKAIPVANSQEETPPIVSQPSKAPPHSSKAPYSSLDTTAEHEFKEPEIRTFDPDAPLPTNKKTRHTQSVTVTPTMPNNADNQKGISNPFANLSLDESWDPNSPEKPKVEQKQRAPKSQALIEAEERAKKMQTKE